MAHNITNSDQVFSVRSPMWHNLGTVLDDYPTLEEARVIAHNWEPVTEPLFRRVLNPDLTEYYELVEEAQGVVRSDNNAHLGVVSDGWAPVLNKTMYDIADALQDVGDDLKIETAGSLKGGRKVWLLIRLNEPLTVKGDPNGEVVPYFALQNAHDGTGSFRGQATVTRIICQNTAQMADLDSTRRGTEFTFRHTSTIDERIAQAKGSLAQWRESVNDFMMLSQHLMSFKVNKEIRNDFIDRYHPIPKNKQITERVRNNILAEREKMSALFDSETQKKIGGTAYGLLQAGLEYNQHIRATKGADENARVENRFTRAYLDRSQVAEGSMRILRDMFPIPGNLKELANA